MQTLEDRLVDAEARYRRDLQGKDLELRDVKHQLHRIRARYEVLSVRSLCCRSVVTMFSLQLSPRPRASPAMLPISRYPSVYDMYNDPEEHV